MTPGPPPAPHLLALKYAPFALRIAKGFAAVTCDTQDMAAEFRAVALLALCRAARSFDPSYGLKFATYAGIFIGGALRDAAMAMTPRGYRGDGDPLRPIPKLFPISVMERRSRRARPAGGWHAEKLTIEHFGHVISIPEPPNTARRVDLLDFLERHMRGLSARSRAILRLRLVDGRGCAATARAVGLNLSRFHHVYQDALGHVRRSIASTGQTDYFQDVA